MRASCTSTTHPRQLHQQHARMPAAPANAHPRYTIRNCNSADSGFAPTHLTCLQGSALATVVHYRDFALIIAPACSPVPWRPLAHIAAGCADITIALPPSAITSLPLPRQHSPQVRALASRARSPPLQHLQCELVGNINPNSTNTSTAAPAHQPCVAAALSPLPCHHRALAPAQVATLLSPSAVAGASPS